MAESYEVRGAGNLPPGLIAQKTSQLRIFLNQQGVATRPAEQAAGARRITSGAELR